MAEESKNLQPSVTIAKIFGVSVRRVEQLKQEGIIEGAGRPTKYDLLPTIQRYIKYLADKASGRETKQKNFESETAKLDAEVRIKKAKAEMVELELKEMRGQLHRAEDVEAIVTDNVLKVRSMLLAMPGKLAVDTARIKTAPEAAERIKQEVSTILVTLADYKYDADAYKELVRERQGWEGVNDDGDEDEE